MEKKWFRTKERGISWYPASWQGALVTLVYIAIIILLAFFIDLSTLDTIQKLSIVVPLFLLLTLIFMKIVHKKSEFEK